MQTTAPGTRSSSKPQILPSNLPCKGKKKNTHSRRKCKRLACRCKEESFSLPSFITATKTSVSKPEAVWRVSPRSLESLCPPAPRNTEPTSFCWAAYSRRLFCICFWILSKELGEKERSRQWLFSTQKEVQTQYCNFRARRIQAVKCFSPSFEWISLLEKLSYLCD